MTKRNKYDERGKKDDDGVEVTIYIYMNDMYMYFSIYISLYLSISDCRIRCKPIYTGVSKIR